ncbi:MAG TPA: peptide chain release factor N(5)-glutamine methyltransferase [Burkholderiales bacterium]|nr:peptide chain release factor N(5)-glutamine methyltransferase [Burkholderiales bacterium]
MFTIEKALREARAAIGSTDARVLLRHVLATSNEFLATHPEQALTVEQTTAFQALVARRELGEPVAYLISVREFYGLEFLVTPDVLIPRPETELLVDLALQRIPVDYPRHVLDLGVGSGAIAIGVAANRPLAKITATDISATALQVAQQNAERLIPFENRANIAFIKSDWYSNLGDTLFDVILTNPPYVAENDPHMQQGDLRFEPANALTPGGDGLDAFRAIIGQAPIHLHSNGWLLCEHGYDQAKAVRALLITAGFQSVVSHKDLSGIPRTTIGRIGNALNIY